MPTQTSNMDLQQWPLGVDLFAHFPLSNNWEKVDLHDHSPGKGVQVPTAGIANLAVDTTKLASGSVTKVKLGADVDYESAFSTYKHVARQSGSPVLALTAGSARVVGLPFYLAPADYKAGTRTTLFRLRYTLFCNAVASTVTGLTAGLHACTAVAGTGGAITYTVDDAAVVSSTVALTPATSTRLQAASSDFAVASAGWYATAVKAASNQAANSAFAIDLALQVHQT